MAKDERLWIKLTTDFFRQPKITRLSDGAKVALLEMFAHCRELPNDGFLESNYASRLWRDYLPELMANGENPSLFEVEGGYQIRDYLEHQQSSAEIQAHKDKQKENGMKGGRPRKPKNNPVGIPVANPVANPNHNPNETQTKAESESESESDLTTQRFSVSPVVDVRELSTDPETNTILIKRTAKLGITDLQTIQQLASDRCQRDLEPADAITLCQAILDKSSTRVGNPQAYVVSAFKNSIEVQAIIDRGIPWEAPRLQAVY